MRLMQRLAVSGLLSVILIVLLTGTFVTRRSLANMVDRGVAPEERNEQPLNPAWVLHNTVPGPGPDELKNEDKDRRVDAAANRQSEPSAVGPPPIPVPAPYAIKLPNPPLDDVTNQRREKIKEMMKHGWDNYVRYAWGKNELKPISKKGHSASIFGAANMGATIVDGLDTLYIMGLHDEFKQGRDWIAENLDFDIVSTLKLVETSLYNSLQVLSFTFPLLLFLFRYVGFITSFPIVKFVFDSVEYDYVATKDPIEADLFTKQIEEARQVVTALVVLAVAEIFSLCVLLLVPTLLQSNLQIHYLHFFGFLYPERSTQTDWASVQVIIVTSLGLLAIACTESSLAVFVAYLCGLLEIASYRLRTVVDEMANSATVPSNVIDVGPAMELHQRAVELVYLAVGDISDLENIFVSVQMVVVHLLIVFVNNHSGQKLINTSVELFHDVYNSSWYRVPLKSQKLLLFILMRSSVELQFSLAGLFVPCYEGFSMMVSSSFSYFTMITSV
ncbi:uncharacterized protein LOC117223883 isoform X3 [Megalopta genalis]|uniref:uncharacterized protein LOC117223883 isoform X3 n=1 Tax=Megalopta genalis TaxID=115081 RepID=UPI003FCFA7D4